MESLRQKAAPGVGRAGSIDEQIKERIKQLTHRRNSKTDTIRHYFMFSAKLVFFCRKSNLGSRLFNVKNQKSEEGDSDSLGT